MPQPRLPILLLHGALGSCEQVRWLGSLLRHDRTVLAPDFAGHGLKNEGGGDFGIRGFAADACAFLDRNGIGTADVFGYSMGGYVGLYMARHHPRRVGRVMTLGTKFAWDEATAAKEASRLDPGTLESKVPAFAARLREWHGSSWTKVVRSTARMMLGLGGRPELTTADLRLVRNRVLVAVGDRDAMVSVGETLETYRLLPHGEFLVLPGTPHPFDQVDRELLVSLVRRFFAADDGESPAATARDGAHG